MYRKQLPAGMKVMLIGSALFHVGVGFAVLTVGSWGRAAPRRFDNVLSTKLVKLGKKRDKDLLPRIQPQAKPQAPAPVIVPKAPTPTKPAPATPEPKRLSASERLKQMTELKSALNRVRKKTVDTEGDPDGVEGGTATETQLSLMEQKFYGEVHRCIHRNWTVEGLDESKVQGLTAGALVRVKPDGKFGSIEIVESSGNKRFDRLVERAVRRCGRVSAPPEPLRDTLKTDGFLFNFSP